VPDTDLTPWIDDKQYLDFIDKPYKASLKSLINALTSLNPVQEFLDKRVVAWIKGGLSLSETELQKIYRNINELVITEDATALIRASKADLERKKQLKSDLEEVLPLKDSSAPKERFPKLLKSILLILIAVPITLIISNLSFSITALNALLITTILIVISGVIGNWQGWDKSLFTISSLLFGLFIVHIFENYMFFTHLLDGGVVAALRFVIMGLSLLSGYRIYVNNLEKFNRDSGSFKEHIWRIILGAISGYLLFGSILYFLNSAGFSLIDGGTIYWRNEKQFTFYDLLPPSVLSGDRIFFAVGLDFLLMLVIFI